MVRNYDKNSPILCDTIDKNNDKIADKKALHFKERTEYF